MLGVIAFSEIASVMSEIITLDDLAHDIALSYGKYLVFLDLEKVLCSLKDRTNIFSMYGCLIIKVLVVNPFVNVSYVTK